MSDLTTAYPQLLPTTASARRMALSAKPVKMSLAAAIALLGSYGVLVDRQYVSTSDAVVSTYVLDVRTPIEGTVADVPATAGDLVRAGSVVARVGNTLTDHQHLDNLRITAEAAQSTAEALSKEREALEALRGRLLARAALHTGAMRDRMLQDVAQAGSTLAAKRTASHQADLDLERGRQLVSDGVISRAAYEQTLATQQVLADEVSALEAAYASLQAQAGAVSKGVLSEPGTNNDVAYSVQRADELAIKLAENARALDAARAQASEAQREAAAEEKRASQLGSFEVHAPSSGMIWKLGAINGEHVEADSPVLSLVDCRRQFVLAEVPQDRVSTILLGSRAEIKLTGESNERSGTVMTVSGGSEGSSLDGKFAAAPLRKLTEDLATVVVRLDSPAQAAANSPCLIGRTARVRVATQPTNLLSLWFSQRI